MYAAHTRNKTSVYAFVIRPSA